MCFTCLDCVLVLLPFYYSVTFSLTAFMLCINSSLVVFFSPPTEKYDIHCCNDYN